jgi:hypothetical protein
VPYSQWRSTIGGMLSSNDEVFAQVWNLEHETRIDLWIEEFKQKIGSIFLVWIGRGTPPDKAASEAFNEVRMETYPVDSKWLGLLPVPIGAKLPTKMTTHAPIKPEELARYHSLAFLPLSGKSRSVLLSRPLMTMAGPGGRPILRRRFIWFTFETGGRKLSDTPKQIVIEMGLNHYEEGDYVFRCHMAVDHSRLFIPTCLDARVCEAWAPPPLGHSTPWGMTRNLESGESEWPELLAEVKDYIGLKPTAELVSPAGTKLPVGHFNVNFRVNRG